LTLEKASEKPKIQIEAMPTTVGYPTWYSIFLLIFALEFGIKDVAG
jgi:hypothetical protein